MKGMPKNGILNPGNKINKMLEKMISGCQPEKRSVFNKVKSNMFNSFLTPISTIWKSVCERKDMDIYDTTLLDV